MSAASPHTPLLLTACQARQRLGVGEAAFKRILESGKLRTIILPGGKRPRFTEADLDEFIEDRRTTWRSNVGKGHRSGGTRSPSEVVDFAEAQKRYPAKKRR